MLADGDTVGVGSVSLFTVTGFLVSGTEYSSV